MMPQSSVPAAMMPMRLHLSPRIPVKGEDNACAGSARLQDSMHEPVCIGIQTNSKQHAESRYLMKRQRALRMPLWPICISKAEREHDNFKGRHTCTRALQRVKVPS